ncbi:MAG: undecaprenyl-diphosphate phosphatase [Anaerolineae bacterium]|nr:undecaprenyl-diphosphate phosphatase [Anaerolineae bacterium]
MTIWQAAVLGALQGATEFLPISSSGHLVLVPWLLGWEANSLFFGAAVHMGTLAAVLAYFRQDLWVMARAWVRTLRYRQVADPYGRLAWLVIAGTIPAALAGVLLEDWFEAMFSSPLLVSVLLLVTGGFLALAERLSRERKAAEQASLPDAVMVGLAQALAIAPGISRSGATIAAGLGRGINRAEAARFSFLLATPIIAGAGLLEVAQVTLAGDLPSLLLGLVGGLTAAATGFVAIGALIRYLRQRSLLAFACYCWAFGGLCLAIVLVRG